MIKLYEEGQRKSSPRNFEYSLIQLPMNYIFNNSVKVFLVIIIRKAIHRGVLGLGIGIAEIPTVTDILLNKSQQEAGRIRG